MPADPVDAGLPQPTDIKLRRAEQQLRIQWRDGHCSELSAGNAAPELPVCHLPWRAREAVADGAAGSRHG